MKFRKLAWILPILLCCCNKTPPTPVRIVEFSFKTQYDSILICEPNTTDLFLFNVNVLSGNIDTSPVNFALTGLPPNVAVIPTSQSVTEMLGGVFTFAVGNVPYGNDTLNLSIGNAIYGTQNHKLILKIAPPADFSPRLVGAYSNTYDYCTPVDSLYYYTSSVSTVVDTPYEIRIKNLKNLGGGFIVTAWVSTNITIPVQTIGSYTIWGSGTYTHDNPPNNAEYQMMINDTLVNGLDTERCIVHLQH